VAKGTVVHFTTVLESDGSAYSSSAAAPRQIPVHVYTGMDNVPSQFRPGAHCSAYWVSPLTVKGN
jgi:hypothetical protein